jgi:hypothetical protein
MKKLKKMRKMKKMREMRKMKNLIQFDFTFLNIFFSFLNFILFF